LVNRKLTTNPVAGTNPECAICLQSCVHPVQLPCCHVFCFLCVKGASWHSKRCALCRQEVPEDFLERPVLLSPEELKAAAAGLSRGVGGSAHKDYENISSSDMSRHSFPVQNADRRQHSYMHSRTYFGF
uniref:E3 ubiquitin-protein ligase n=1 Tax=Periophthalmus magnuspinnatus TaxID=409849 RepID=A0A3B4A7H9_9GOBI